MGGYKGVAVNVKKPNQNTFEWESFWFHPVVVRGVTYPIEFTVSFRVAIVILADNHNHTYNKRKRNAIRNISAGDDSGDSRKLFWGL